MLKELKFVQGTISKKDYVPAMSHFQIGDGSVKSFNGFMTISSPIECNLKCNPKGHTLVKAITNCESDHITLTLTAKGRLSIKSGSFKALVECLDDVLPIVEPEGTFYQIDGESFYETVRDLYPIIGDDVTRPWSNGVLLRNGYAYATNNVILARKQINSNIPLTINLPKAVVKELLRVKEYSNCIQTDGNSITFHYDKNKWIKTATLDPKWPDADKILETDCKFTAPPKDLFKAIVKLKDFGDDGRVHLHRNLISTCALEHTEEVHGSQITVEGLDAVGIFQIEMLTRISTIAEGINFQNPEKAFFCGKNLVGVIAGLRQ